MKKLLIKSLLSVFIQFLLSVQLNGASLTRNELREKYGQANTTFNDGKSCYRTCDGQTKTCYFEFNAQVYDTMSDLCGNCEYGVLSDCFKTGCITGNGIQRVIMSINQRLPGPPINVCKGDRIIVDLKNHISGIGLSYHWHGISQEKTPFMDGVALLTQCPINTGNTFRYAFYASEAGTHVAHAHSGVHRSNGLVGPLIVREENDPNAKMYDYDLAEHHILLFDWDNELAESHEPGVQNASPKPDSVLINGFGNYFDTKVNKYKFAPMEVFYVQRGKKHRLRIANAGTHICPIEISIKHHKLTVIATDGSPIEPVAIDSLVTSPGERFDVILNAINDPNINETLLTVRVVSCNTLKVQEFARIIFVDDIFNHSKSIGDHRPLNKKPTYDSLEYPKISLNHPLTDCSTSKSYCVSELQQIKSSKAENLRNVKPFKIISLNYEMIFVNKRHPSYIATKQGARLAVINRIANTHTTVPLLLQSNSNVEYCNAKKLPKPSDIANDSMPIYHCPHMIELELNKVYELDMVDVTTIEDISSHPIHLHGNSFQVIDMGTEEQLKSGKIKNAKHPPVIKDTVVLPRNGFVRVRFRATNPGYWLLHCHFEFHVEPGMVAVFKVGNRTDMQLPPADFPTCGDYMIPVDE